MPRSPFGRLDTLLLMDLSAEHYELLLNWLHPNREEAEKEYGRIRNLLVRKFQRQECADPDFLADATMERVARKLMAGVENLGKQKEPYFHRVGYNILREDRNKRSRETQIPDDYDVPQPREADDSELQSYCLDQCLQEHSIEKRELVVRYYWGTKGIKIRNRAELAEEQGRSLTSLRVTAGRVRQKLKICIEKCLEDAARQSTHSLPM